MPGRHLLEDPVAETEPESEALLIAFLSLVLILVAALLIGRLLHRLHVMWLSEAGAALLLGLAIGLLVRAAGAGETYLDKLTFNPDLFMYILLPVIMFDAGYSLDPKPFVRNIGSISAFAFLGTTMSTFIVGYLMYAFGEAGWCVQIGANYNLLFGAIISATDPVTVLAIFSQLGANTDLYINVFGESVLNDAVAMVIYETLQKFVHDPVTVGNVFLGIATFFVIFIGSVVFGVGLGFLAAVMFKTRWFLDYHNPLTESGVVVCTAFLSYLAPQAFHFSGIVSVLFCSIVMRLYVRPNLSTITQHHVEGLFKVLAGLFELFLFVYIGLTLFLTDETAKVAIYFAFVLLTLAVSRACNIFPLSAIVNWFRLPQRRIPGKQQFMMWWSGLRGAMAFALAIDAKNKYGDVGLLMQTCTFYIVFVTVLVNGGSAGLLLNKLNLLEPSHPPIEEGEDTMNSTGNEIVEFAACGPNGKEEDRQATAVGVEGVNGDATGHVRVAAAASPAAVDIELGSGVPAHTRMDRWREFVSVDLDAKMNHVARVLSQRLVNPPQLTADPSTRGAAATAAEPPHAVVSQEMNGQVSGRGPSRRQANSGATGPNQ